MQERSRFEREIMHTAPNYISQDNSLIANRSFEISGTDDRVKINNTKNTPWKWICHIEIYKLNNRGQWNLDESVGGTGILISPYHVLTAAHVLDYGTKGIIRRKIKVFPGRNGQSNNPFGEYNTNGWVILNSFDRKSRSDDLGLIRLTKKVNSIGYWGSDKNWVLGGLSEAELKNHDYYVAGYPGSVRNRRSYFFQYQHHGPGKVVDCHGPHVYKVCHKEIEYLADTSKGQSGGPVWVNKNGIHHLVGIHSGINRTVYQDANIVEKWNGGIWISPEVLNIITEMQRDMPFITK